MYISGTRADNIPDLGSITIGEQIPNLLVNDIDACAPTYLSWGAETDIWTNKKNHIFMGGFESANARLEDASDAENEEWMRVANALGWQKWELEWTKDKPKKIEVLRNQVKEKIFLY